MPEVQTGSQESAEVRRQAIYDKFWEAEQARQRILQIAMTEAYAHGSEVLSPSEQLGLSLTGSLEETARLTSLEARVVRCIGEPILAVLPFSQGGLAGLITEVPSAEMPDSRSGHLTVWIRQAFAWRLTWPSPYDRGPRGAKITLAKIQGETGHHYEYEYRSTGRPVLYRAEYPYEEEGSLLLVGHDELIASPAAAAHKPVLVELYKLIGEQKQSV